MQYITLDQLISELDLEVIYKATDAVDVRIFLLRYIDLDYQLQDILKI